MSTRENNCVAFEDQFRALAERNEILHSTELRCAILIFVCLSSFIPICTHTGFVRPLLPLSTFVSYSLLPLLPLFFSFPHFRSIFIALWAFIDFLSFVYASKLMCSRYLFFISFHHLLRWKCIVFLLNWLELYAIFLSVSIDLFSFFFFICWVSNDIDDETACVRYFCSFSLFLLLLLLLLTSLSFYTISTHNTTKRLHQVVRLMRAHSEVFFQYENRFFRLFDTHIVL